MGKTLSLDAVVSDRRLSPEAKKAILEIGADAREGFLALCTGAGLGVLDVMMEHEVEQLAGPKGKHNPARKAKRHGHEDGQVVLGGRKLPVRRPRVRSTEGDGELPIPTYEHCSKNDLLSEVVLERMLAGVSTRKYRRVSDPVGEQIEQSVLVVSKSSVSREFVKRTQYALRVLMERSLADVRIAALMIDGVHFKNRTCLIALGISTQGAKIPLAVMEGSSENKTVVTALLADLVDRGLDVSQGVLCVIDGAKALRAAINDVFGADTPVQRCIRHKERNVLDYLPDHMRDVARARLRQAWNEPVYEKARALLLKQVSELEKGHPGAAASLREGLEETLTVTRLKIDGSLRKTLQSTNPIESIIACVRRTARNVKNWSSGEMTLRWIAAGLYEARRQSNRVQGAQQLAELALKIEHLHKPEIEKIKATEIKKDFALT